MISILAITRNTINMPTDWLGNKTGHLLGLLYRSQLCMENNIKPIWVFDGRPPASKYK
jgi:flap endonuclease-1